jgi:hypothetical protein
MATTTPNFGWPVPTSTDLVKDGATAIEALGDSIDASLVDLKGGTTGQVLSKTSGTDMDFTWVTSDDANAIQNTIVDAKGDLIAATAADTPARLAVGTNGQVLTADSTAATGLAWASAAASSGPAFNAYPTGTAQTISVSTWTKVRLNSENFDTDNCFDSTTNYRFTPNKAGYYQLNMAVNMPSDGRVYGSIYKNGTAYTMAWAYNEADSGNSGSGLIYCNGSTDYIEFYVYLYSGSATISAGTSSTQCSGVWIRG